MSCPHGLVMDYICIIRSGGVFVCRFQMVTSLQPEGRSRNECVLERERTSCLSVMCLFSDAHRLRKDT